MIIIENEENKMDKEHRKDCVWYNCCDHVYIYGKCRKGCLGYVTKIEYYIYQDRKIREYKENKNDRFY